MRRTIHVALGENARDLGTLRFDARGARESAAFAYEAVWLTAADHFMIHPGLPLVSEPGFHRKEHGGSVFHGAIADTEPDGWACRVILRDHAKRRQQARRAGRSMDGSRLPQARSWRCGSPLLRGSRRPKPALLKMTARR